MNETKHPTVNTKLRLLALCALVTLLCSCAATSVKSTWKSPDFHGPVGKIAVLAIEERGLLRKGFENRFSQQLSTNGMAALTTYDLLSLPQIKQDKRAAADQLGASGAKVLLFIRLVDKTSSYREYRPGREHYAAVVTGVDTMGWYDYYSLGLMDMSATYSSTRDWVYLETCVYDLKTEKRLWSAMTQTVVTEDMDRVAEMDLVVERVLTAMRKDGLVP